VNGVEALLAEAVALIARDVQPERILIYGSRAKGTATAASDLDLLVVTHHPVPPARQLVVQEAFRDAPLGVDVVFCTTAQVRVRQPHSFLGAILQAARQVYPEADLACEF
jgi:predicted nucleotidyltransferase